MVDAATFGQSAKANEVPLKLEPASWSTSLLAYPSHNVQRFGGGRGHNWNQFVLAALVYAINELDLDAIDQKFLETGHTLMECDSMHRLIEQLRKK